MTKSRNYDIEKVLKWWGYCQMLCPNRNYAKESKLWYAKSKI